MLSSIGMVVYGVLFSSCTQGAGALEQIEADIARIVEETRPAVVRVSVKVNQPQLLHGLMMNPQGLRWDTELAPLAEEEEQELREQAAEAKEKDSDLKKSHERLAQIERSLNRGLGSGSYSVTPRLHHNLLTQRLELATLPGRSIGSGFLVGGGYVLTTHTLAGNGEEFTVTLHNGKELQGKLVGSDDLTDTALLKVEEQGLPSTRFGDSSRSRTGSFGIFLSRSYGEIDNVKIGLVTGRDDGGPVGTMLRLNFPILPGESGAPLLNSRGEVIGIASANLRRSFHAIAPQAFESNPSLSFVYAVPNADFGESSKEFSYFIPSERMREIIEELKAHGEVRRAFFGISGSDTTLRISGDEDLAGVLIEEVHAGSAADQGGLLVGDVLLAIGGKKTENFDELRRTIERLPIGKPVEVVVRRGGKELRLEVSPNARSSSKRIAPAAPGSFGVKLVPKSEELAAFLNLADSPDGKVVASVDEGGLAQRAGLRKGDLVLDEIKSGKPIRVWRDGKTIELLIPSTR